MAADTVQQIKEKLGILEVVQPYVKLTKAGRFWRGLSPFNKEKTPSFYVNPERGTYYCFSSGQGGDHFTFIEKMEGVDFKGALKILAEKAGVKIEAYSGGQDKGRADRLREAAARAEAFFERSLDEKGPAYAYAKKRGLTDETIRAWHLGLALDSWRALLEQLTEAGFTTAELAAAGLIKEADEKKGTWYDRFRNRLMFPIRDAAGRTVAFTGRALDADDQAKYLNSPETELFKKSHILFGMDRAKDAIRTRGFALLVEGQFDLLLLHQVGFTNTIALSGTALSGEHLSLIKRYADNLMLALDSDRAGLAASAKNAIAALAAGMRVKAVRLPKGKDPADIVSEDPKEFTRLVSEAQTVIEFFLSVLAAEEPDQHRLVLAVERIVLPLVAAVKSPMEREHFIGIIARAISSTPDAVRASLPKAGALPVEESQQRAAQPAVTGTSPTEGRTLLLLAVAANYPDTPLAERVVSEYARIIGAPPAVDTVPERALFEAGLLFGEAPPERAADDLIRVLEQAVIARDLASATLRLRQAESSRDAAAIAEAAKACADLSVRLSRFS